MREPDVSLKAEVEALDLQDDKDLKKLKHMKRQRKAALTRTIGAIDVSIAEKNPAEVQVKLQLLSRQFANLEFVRST